jgi:hypothetical protein
MRLADACASQALDWLISREERRADLRLGSRVHQFSNSLLQAVFELLDAASQRAHFPISQSVDYSTSRRFFFLVGETTAFVDRPLDYATHEPPVVADHDNGTFPFVQSMAHRRDCLIVEMGRRFVKHEAVRIGPQDSCHYGV